MMREGGSEAEGGGPTSPLFVLSFRQRDELAATATAAGWQVVAARRREGAPRRLLASGARVAVIDARGALEEGIAAVAAMAELSASHGGAMLVLVSRNDIAALGALYDAGATHFLASPFAASEFVQALRFAERHAERVGGEVSLAQPGAEPLGWRLDATGRQAVLTPALAAMLQVPERVRARDLLGRLERDDRRAAVAALRRLGADRTATAFAHDLGGVGRVVEHLSRDPHSGRLEALVEPLGAAPDVAAAMREALAARGDARAVRRWISTHLADPAAPLHVLLVALTRFDLVNASYGRAAGDGLLRDAGRRLDEVAREALGRAGREALVMRTTGAEFVVAAAAPASAVALAAEAIAGAMSRPFVVEGAAVPTGVRIGVAAGDPSDDAAALLRRAAQALAEARGADGVTIRHSRQDLAGVPSVEDLAVDLRRAIEAGEIAVQFQPQVSIATDRTVGVEALARWEHPRLGSLGAEALFAAAERADLGLVLSQHIQQLVLDTAAAWPPVLADLRLSLNVTAFDIARSDFADLLLDRVDASGFPRERLTVEITESGLIEDLPSAARLLATLREAGCRTAIDDFGTGYSSLAYLKALPLDYLKIDKHLAQDIAGSPRDRVVVRGVIEMARSLGLEVIAEGVEVDTHRDLLASQGCAYYQGFLRAPALDVPALIQLLESEGDQR